MKKLCLVLCVATLGLCAQDNSPLPSWLTVGGQIRERGEAYTGSGWVVGRDYEDVASRLRLNLGIKVTPWLLFFGEAQDSRVFNYYTRPVPNNQADSVDLRQAYVKIGNPEMFPVTVKFGRQELAFGDERLVGVADWNNVTKFFDAARVTYKGKSYEVDAFASSLVVTIDGQMDHHQDGLNLHGLYGSFHKWIPKATVDTYMFWRTNPLVGGEVGPKASLSEFTYGTRLDGKLPWRFDYNVEMALQRGSYAHDAVRASAGHWLGGYKIKGGDRFVRAFGQYNYASGDKNSADGTHQGFDQLFPANHNKYGLADLFGWKNLREAQLGAEWQALKKVKVSAAVSNVNLATVLDSLYNLSCSAVTTDKKATSTHVGEESDVWATYAFSKHVTAGAGYAYLLAGSYLRQAGKGTGSSASYLTWSYKF